MSNFVFVPQFGGGPAPMSATETSQRWELGLMVLARDMGQSNAAGTTTPTATTPTLGGGMFQYVQGYTANQPQSAGQLVVLIGNSAMLARSDSTGTVGAVGIAAGAISASNVYGWVMRQGLCDYARGATAGDFGAVGGPCFVGTTAGQVQTTAGATGYRIGGMGIWSTGASVANSTNQSVYLDFPKFQGAP